MKKLMIIVIALVAMTATAQRGGGERGLKDLSAEDQAKLQTKQMSLALVLDESQTNRVYQINLEQAKKRIANREARKQEKDESLTKEQRLAKREQQLDDRIAVQNKMQQILNEDQFKQWRKMSHRRGKGQRREGEGEGRERKRGRR